MGYQDFETGKKKANKLMMKKMQECFTMAQLLNKVTRFENFLESVYTTYITFKQCNRFDSVTEKLRHFSRKHYLYGCKNEISYYLIILLLKCLGLILDWFQT